MPARPSGLADRVALSVSEAAAALGVSEAHLRNHLHEVPHFHLGGRVLFPLGELHAWAKRQADREHGQAKKEADELLGMIR